MFRLLLGPSSRGRMCGGGYEFTQMYGYGSGWTAEEAG